jgi:hypothetical protein
MSKMCEELDGRNSQSLSLGVQSSYEGAAEAWLGALSSLVNSDIWVPGVVDPLSVGSSFGEQRRDTREMISVSFSIKTPRRRLIYSRHRRVDISYAIANAIWTFIGSGDLDLISFYNPRGEDFSDDGATLFAAPGPRILSPSCNQVDRIVETLTRDPSSRRALMQIFLPSDLLSETRDCSCIMGMQFFIRENKLSCLALMRSQSALMILPYDLFMLTMLHEAVACRLGKRIGPYYHFCGSLHYYRDEEDFVHRSIQGGAESLCMPPMKVADSGTLKKIEIAEKDIRGKLARSMACPIDFLEYGLDRYWTELLRVLVAGTRRRYGLQLSLAEERSVSLVYRQMLRVRYL